MEHQTNAPESVQNKSEQAERERHDVISEQLIESARNTNPMQRLVAMDAYLGDIRADAAGGYVKNSKGESYDIDAFNAQLAVFKEQINLPEDERDIEDPFALIPRSEGLRDSFRTLLSEASTSQAFLDALDGKADLLKQASPERGFEQPTPTEHAIGEQALAASGVATLGETVGEQVPNSVEAKEETDIEMYERFVRESKAELQDLYEQHRNAPQGSYESGSLENQIRNAKEDLNDNMNKLNKARRGM